jgi:hypothetical protein
MEYGYLNGFLLRLFLAVSVQNYGATCAVLRFTDSSFFTQLADGTVFSESNVFNGNGGHEYEEK